MPKPTPAEAMALLRETVAKAEQFEAAIRSGTASAAEITALRPARLMLESQAPTLAGLVAELYEALGEACHELDGAGGGVPNAPLEALRACEDALVAWAEGVAVPSTTEPQRGG